MFKTKSKPTVEIEFSLNNLTETWLCYLNYKEWSCGQTLDNNWRDNEWSCGQILDDNIPLDLNITMISIISEDFSVVKEFIQSFVSLDFSRRVLSPKRVMVNVKNSGRSIDGITLQDCFLKNISCYTNIERRVILIEKKNSFVDNCMFHMIIAPSSFVMDF